MISTESDKAQEQRAAKCQYCTLEVQAHLPGSLSAVQTTIDRTTGETVSVLTQRLVQQPSITDAIVNYVTNGKKKKIHEIILDFGDGRTISHNISSPLSGPTIRLRTYVRLLMVSCCA